MIITITMHGCNLHCIVYSYLQCKCNALHCTARCIYNNDVLHSALCTVHYVLCTVHWNKVHSVQCYCTVHCALMLRCFSLSGDGAVHFFMAFGASIKYPPAPRYLHIMQISIFPNLRNTLSLHFHTMWKR